MNIVEATQKYENRLKKRLAAQGLAVDHRALDAKHAAMAGTPYSFFRATYYRWAELWPDLLRAHLKHAVAPPKILSVGDLHAENFGTWRDAEGRLVWGVNDLDEACALPYLNDLVRLATSVPLTRADHNYRELNATAVCGELWEGYKQTLVAGRDAAAPLVLSEENEWLREIASGQLRDPAKFWAKLLRASEANENNASGENASGEDVAFPSTAHAAIQDELPAGLKNVVWKRRQAGLGSLGKPRFVAVGTWQGGRIAREAKALTSSAALARGKSEGDEIQQILSTAVRSPDPYYHVSGGWLVRRLAPDCTKLDLSEMPRTLERNYLFAMGRETANIHLGSKDAIPAVLKHMAGLPNDWLLKFSKDAAELVRNDWRDWRKHYPLDGAAK